MIKNKKNLVLFDFCETLIKFQTADRYIDYCRSILNTPRMRILQFLLICLDHIYFFRIMNRLVPNNSYRKKFVLYQLKGYNYNVLDKLAYQYYENCLKTSFITEVMNKLSDHFHSGDCIWIISGGYDIYIKYFIKDFSLSGYISTKISFSKGFCNGKIEGTDCMRENKVSLIKETFSNQIDKMTIYAYSDSYSDLPLLLFADYGYVISRRKSQKWAYINNLNEIIWE